MLDGIESGSVRGLADALDERERTVLWRHYGLGQPPQTLSTIGSALGLSAERVRQIEASALEKLARGRGATATRRFDSASAALTHTAMP